MPGGFYEDVETSPALRQLTERVGRLEQLYQERLFDSWVNNEKGLVYNAQLELAFTNNASRVSQVHYVRRDGVIEVEFQLYPGATAHAADMVTGVPAEFRPRKDLRFPAAASTQPAAGAAGWSQDVQFRTDGAIRWLRYGTVPAGITDTSQYIIGTAVYLARL